MWPPLAIRFQGYHPFSATFEVPGTKSLLFFGLTQIKADISRDEIFKEYRREN
jgi:hypothetical protein